MSDSTEYVKQEIRCTQLNIVCGINLISVSSSIIVSDTDYTDIVNWIFEVLHTRHLPTIYRLFPNPLHKYIRNGLFNLITVNDLLNHEKIISDIEIKFAKAIELVKLLLLTEFLDND